MQKVKTLFILFCAAIACYLPAQERFVNCTAAFLNDKIVVDEYSPTGKCILPATATGILSVCTADLSPERCIPIHPIKFMVAVRDQHSKTLLLLESKPVKRVDIVKLLSKCKPGDSLVILTLEDKYALPHHEILIK